MKSSTRVQAAVVVSLILAITIIVLVITGVL
jgi:hypothetical protein